MQFSHDVFHFQVEWRKIDGRNTEVLTRGDNVITDNDRIEITQDSFIDEESFLLIINNVRSSDEGEYECATTGSDSVSDTTELRVTGGEFSILKKHKNNNNNV